jgi:hypothetical protein
MIMHVRGAVLLRLGDDFWLPCTEYWVVVVEQ